jgi:hypothetical protein
MKRFPPMLAAIGLISATVEAVGSRAPRSSNGIDNPIKINGRSTSRVGHSRP